MRATKTVDLENKDIMDRLVNNLIDDEYGEDNKVFVIAFNSALDFIFEQYSSLVEAINRAVGLKNAKIINKGKEIKYKEFDSTVIYLDTVANNIGEIRLKA